MTRLLPFTNYNVSSAIHSGAFLVVGQGGGDGSESDPSVDWEESDWGPDADLNVQALEVARAARRNARQEARLHEWEAAIEREAAEVARRAAEGVVVRGTAFRPSQIQTQAAGAPVIVQGAPLQYQQPSLLQLALLQAAIRQQAPLPPAGSFNTQSQQQQAPLPPAGSFNTQSQQQQQAPLPPAGSFNTQSQQQQQAPQPYLDLFWRPELLRYRAGVSGFR